MDTAQTKAIKRRAADILKQYRQLARMAGEPLAPYTSPLTQGMPTIDGERIGHRSHDGMDFAGMLTEIDMALLALTPKRRDVLAYAYCTREHLKLPELAKSMHIHSRWDRKDPDEEPEKTERYPRVNSNQRPPSSFVSPPFFFSGLSAHIAVTTHTRRISN